MKVLIIVGSILIHVQEQPPPIVVAEVKTCKWHASYNPHPIPECKIIELVPSEHSTNSLMGCMRAVSMGTASFWFEGSWWETKGGTCKEKPNTYAQWKASRSR